MSQNNSNQDDNLTEVTEYMHGKHKLIVRIFLSMAILLLGVMAWWGLGALRKAPMPAEIPPPRLKVDVKALRLEEVPVSIFGYGNVKALDSLALTPKVAGEVVYLHPNLEVGNVIEKGELLYRIDQRDYLAAQKQAKAQVERLELTIKLLKRQFEQMGSRIATVRRTRDIALEEFKIDVELLEKKDVGSQSMVNLSEISYQKAHDAFEQVEQAMELFPMRIHEAEIGLEAAKAASEMVALSLERTEEYAPFTARVQHKQIEVGQAVAPGIIVLLLANDSALELSVSIDSRDAKSWLPFRTRNESKPLNWFGEVEPVKCKIKWTEDSDSYEWTGILDRVERFDQSSRTVTVALRIENDVNSPPSHGLPLVEGMYCSVEIPGTSISNVYRLPRWTVSYDGFVYIADGERLQRRAVNAIHTQGEETYVDEGLSPGDLIVVTRLVDPLPGILLEYDIPETPGSVPGDQQ
ncbi:MAG: biotin/lipoyl-binding protein [Candidatus Hydrogenedentes bacterium]|nr:biotin/lipoyl-binding protein [Candidatus Hydrogenedentota bacterium]